MSYISEGVECEDDSRRVCPSRSLHNKGAPVAVTLLHHQLVDCHGLQHHTPVRQSELGPQRYPLCFHNLLSMLHRGCAIIADRWCGDQESSSPSILSPTSTYC